MSGNESASPVLAARGLTKRYGDLVAVDGIDFEVQRAECVGFLGPNGAGKTTTIRVVTAFTPLTAGIVEVFGLDVSRHPREVKARLGLCPQEDNLDPDFTVWKNLLVYGRYHDLPKATVERRAKELLEFVQLDGKADARIEELSGGMKRRLVLARALLNRPELLVLDEPTTGLDPQARHLIWERVRRLKEDGVTVLLTTHYMEEASRLCDRVVLMDHGKILLEGAPDAVIEEEVGREVVELRHVGDEVRAHCREAGWPLDEVEDRIYLFDREGGSLSREIAARFPRQERLIRPATLEDVFLRRTGRILDE
jgi:lipooligosaccharide transport system ATP-binding protein